MKFSCWKKVTDKEKTLKNCFNFISVFFWGNLKNKIKTVSKTWYAVASASPLSYFPVSHHCPNQSSPYPDKPSVRIWQETWSSYSNHIADERSNGTLCHRRKGYRKYITIHARRRKHANRNRPYETRFPARKLTEGRGKCTSKIEYTDNLAVYQSDTLPHPADGSGYNLL